MLCCTENVENWSIIRHQNSLKILFTLFQILKYCVLVYFWDAAEIVDEYVKITYNEEQNYIKD